MNTTCPNDATTVIRGPHGLIRRQRRFADLYLSGMSADQAYIHAGFKDKCPATAASRLLARNGPLNVYIAARRKHLAGPGQLAKWEVVDFLCRVITSPLNNVPGASPPR